MSPIPRPNLSELDQQGAYAKSIVGNGNLFDIAVRFSSEVILLRSCPEKSDLAAFVTSDNEQVVIVRPFEGRTQR